MPFQKTFRILLEEDTTDGSILDSFGGASFIALNGTDASGAMNADSVVLGVDGTAAEGKSWFERLKIWISAEDCYLRELAVSYTHLTLPTNREV